jgi:hypothetical protein
MPGQCPLVPTPGNYHKHQEDAGFLNHCAPNHLGPEDREK